MVARRQGIMVVGVVGAAAYLAGLVTPLFRSPLVISLSRTAG